MEISFSKWKLVGVNGYIYVYVCMYVYIYIYIYSWVPWLFTWSYRYCSLINYTPIQNKNFKKRRKCVPSFPDVLVLNGLWLKMIHEPKRHWSEHISVVYLLSHIQLYATPWTVSHQVPVSKGFPRQEYWSGLSFPSPGDLPDLGMEPTSPALTGGFLTAEPPGKHAYYYTLH